MTDALAFALTGMVIITGATIAEVAKYRAMRGNSSDRDKRVAGLDQRVEHLERELEAIAIETERLGETVRFTAKLLGDLSPAGQPTREPHGARG